MRGLTDIELRLTGFLRPWRLEKHQTWLIRKCSLFSIGIQHYFGDAVCGMDERLLIPEGTIYYI